MPSPKWRPAINSTPDHVERIAFFHGTPIHVVGDYLETTWNGITFRAYQAAPREVAS